MAAPPVPSCPMGLTHRPDAVFQQHREQPCLPAPPGDTSRIRPTEFTLQDSSYRIHFGTPSARLFCHLCE